MEYLKPMLGLTVLAMVTFACGSSPENSNSETVEELSEVQKIVDRAIDFAGGDLFLNSRIEFDFRDRHYVSIRDGGIFQYERIWTDSTGSYRDILDNEGFVRILDGDTVDVVDSMAVKYSNSVNSVIYFALLPYGLNDAAVNKELLGETTLKDTAYYKVKVTFDREGGGEDYQDVFVYWIGKDDYKVDYLGYTYETDGGGVRFRDAFNPRRVNGILFQDYYNYQPPGGKEIDVALPAYDSLFINERLELLSEIVLDNVEVTIDNE